MAAVSLVRVAGGVLFALALVIVVLQVQEAVAAGRRSPGWTARFVTSSGLLALGVAYAFLASPVREWVALLALLEVVAGMALERFVDSGRKGSEP